MPDDISEANLRTGGSLIAADNSVRRQEAAAAATTAAAAERQRWDEMQVGAWSGRTRVAVFSGSAMVSQDVYTAARGYAGTEMVPATGPTRDPWGEAVVRTAQAAWANPVQAGIGVLQSFGNVGPGLVNAAVMAPKLAVEGYLALGNATGLVSDETYLNFRDVQPLQMHTWEPSNDAQRFGQYGTDAVMLATGGISAWNQAGKVGLLREANAAAGTLDVSTPIDRAIVWSNAAGGNLKVADAYVASNPGYMRREMTPGGNYLQNFNLFERFDYEVAIKPWEQLSARYATGASGEVTAFTAGASPRSVFQRIELPILQTNTNVTNIRYMPAVKP